MRAAVTLGLLVALAAGLFIQVLWAEEPAGGTAQPPAEGLPNDPLANDAAPAAAVAPVAADGLIATNVYVIGEAQPVSAELSDGTRHDVTAIHASDRAADLAIVRIARQGLVPLPLGAPQTLLDGQEVVGWLGNRDRSHARRYPRE